MQRLILILLFCVFPLAALAQISPGELTTAHANLEGVQNCTQCHTIGKTISNDRCLVCHSEIASRIQGRNGYHATVRDRACATCHSEHHGRDFSIIHFDRSQFDHTTTGYPLAGKHAGVACDSCHMRSRVTAADIRALLPRRRTTYMGLGRACATCHVDQHRGQLAGGCDQCHSENGWKPAPKFSHDRARYRLTGKHVTVQCAACHNKKIPNTDAVMYRGLAFAGCNDCHTDPHHGKFTQPCTACHTTLAWEQVSGREFNHALTRFPLRGAHAKLQCAACHARSPRERNASGELGFHVTRYQECADCHADAHGSQFIHRKDHGKCEACHNEQSFTLVTYTVEDHDSSVFPLTGAHRATPCIACHVANAVNAKSTRRFRWDGTLTCMTCHKDVHAGQFAGRPGSCEGCHKTTAWQDLAFDHGRSRFPLEGKHRTTPCEKCHIKATPVRYAGLTMVCADCHQEPHAGQFAVDGRTRCEPCHTAISWKNVTLDHAKTRFPLTGKHESVPCNQCHKSETIGGKTIVRYRPLGTKCEDCHASTPDAKRTL